MPNIIYTFETEDGEEIRIFAEETNERATRSRGNQSPEVKRVATSFEKALAPIKYAAKGLKRMMDEVAPDEATVEFSVKTEGSTGVFAICRASTGAEFKITLKWGDSKK